MTKEALIEKIRAKGYAVDFTPDDDCLYCPETGNRYLREHFTIDGSFPFFENGQQKTLHTVQSTEHGLTGYYIRQSQIKAIFNHKVIAESGHAVMFEGSTYFPPDGIASAHFRQVDDYTTTCPVKGAATYYTVEVDGEIRDHAAWSYHTPTPEAARIKGYFAFWKGIKIEK